MTSNVSYCLVMKQFQETFSHVYGPIASVICVINIVFNVCNCMILTHKQLISSTNCILTGIAISDLIKVIALLPMLIRFRVLPELAKHHVATSMNVHADEVSSHFWAVYYLLASLISLTTHTASLWLAVLLAMFRYLCIKLYSNSRIKLWFSLKRAKLSIVLVYLMVLCILAPYFSIVFVQKTTYPRTDLTPNQTIDLYMGTMMQSNASEHIKNLSFWIISILGKFVPCMFMSLFGLLLIATLNATQKHRQSLDSNQRHSNQVLRISHRLRDHQRTTRMLITIITLYIAIEIPNATLIMISRQHVLVHCVYFSLGEVLDLLALLINSVNFLLYCLMSAKFREIFQSTFCWHCSPSCCLANSVPDMWDLANNIPEHMVFDAAKFMVVDNNEQNNADILLMSHLGVCNEVSEVNEIDSAVDTF